MNYYPKRRLKYHQFFLYTPGKYHEVKSVNMAGYYRKMVGNPWRFLVVELSCAFLAVAQLQRRRNCELERDLFWFALLLLVVVMVSGGSRWGVDDFSVVVQKSRGGLFHHSWSIKFFYDGGGNQIPLSCDPWLAFLWIFILDNQPFPLKRSNHGVCLLQHLLWRSFSRF